MREEWDEENVCNDKLWEVANELRPYTELNNDELKCAMECWEDEDLRRVGIYRTSSRIKHWDWQGRRGRLKAYTVRRPVVIWQEVEVYAFNMKGALVSASFGLKDRSGQTMEGGMHIEDNDWERIYTRSIEEADGDWEVELSKNQEF